MAAGIVDCVRQLKANRPESFAPAMIEQACLRRGFLVPTQRLPRTSRANLNPSTSRLIGTRFLLGDRIVGDLPA